MKVLEWLTVRALLILSLLLLAACSYNSFNRTVTFQLGEPEVKAPPKAKLPPAIVHIVPGTKAPVKKRTVTTKRKVTPKKKLVCAKVNLATLTEPTSPVAKLRGLKADDGTATVRILTDYIKELKAYNAQLASQMRVINGQLQKCQSR